MLDDLYKIPSVLYKYRSWNDYTKKILTDHQLYFSDPDDFNDPYECKPIVEKVDFQFTSDAKVFFHNADGSHIESPITNGKLSIGYNLQKQMVEQSWASFRISSFTEKADNILMWSHYADYHKGICLVFDTTKDPVCFANGCGIIYSNKRPICGLGQKVKTVNPLTTKFIDWQYEEEFRIIKNNSEIKKNHHSKLFDFNPEALIEIIFGAKAPLERYFEIRQICDENGLGHVKFSKMHLADVELYKLIKVPIENNL